MRRIKFLGMTLLAVFAFGVVVTAAAQAEEGVSAGLLFLKGEGPPVTMSGSVTTETTITVLGLRAGEAMITCTKTKFSATAGKAGETHVTLGTATIEYTGCKKGATIACSSEGFESKKDAKEVILQAAEDTDIHFVSLLTSTQLVPGVLVGLLKLVNGVQTKNLTIVCGVAKVFVIGAQKLALKSVPSSGDVEHVELTPTLLSCDSADSLCKKLESSTEGWGATATFKNGKIDEKILCPLAAEIEKEFECASLTLLAAMLVEFKPMVEIDF